MTTELTKAAQQALEAFDAFADADDFPTCFELTKKMNALRHALTQRPAAQTEREADDGDVTGQPGPLPETGWDEVPEGAFRKPSPTAGMNLGERIKHVGGRENASGYVEFGSVAAVRALVRQYLRDLPAPQQATPEPDVARLVASIKDDAKHAAYLAEIDNTDGRDKYLHKLSLSLDDLASRVHQQATPEPSIRAEFLDAHIDRTAETVRSMVAETADELGAQAVAGFARGAMLHIAALMTATPTQQAAGEPVGEVPAESILNQWMAECGVYLVEKMGHQWSSQTKQADLLYLVEKAISYTHPAPGVPEGLIEYLRHVRETFANGPMANVPQVRGQIIALDVWIDALAAAQAKGGEA